VDIFGKVEIADPIRIGVPSSARFAERGTSLRISD